MTMSSKRDGRREGAEWEHAATRKVDTLSEAFAAELLRRGESHEPEPGEEAHDRVTARELPGDPEATGAHADRAALDAARLIVVGSDPALPLAGDTRAPRPAPAPPPSASSLTPAFRAPGKLRVALVLLAFLALVAAGLAVLAFH